MRNSVMRNSVGREFVLMFDSRFVSVIAIFRSFSFKHILTTETQRAQRWATQRVAPT